MIQSVFRTVPKTGVIYVMSEARRCGYEPNSPLWTNFGQGQPETGQIPGAPDRLSRIPIELMDQEYSPVAGCDDLRTAVAEHYNRTFRRGMASQYTADNVCIAPGGRAALTRIVSALDRVHLGHFLPDYTAYEELLGIFREFIPIPILLDPCNNYQIELPELRREIQGRGLGALLISNPNNPTGRVIQGDQLEGWISLSRDLNCYLLMDEFYSNYIWNSSHQVPRRVSASAYIEDVNKDPTIILDGLTKNWRYPGWRIAWILGPKSVIESVASTGSFLDGGASRPLQKAAIDLLEANNSDREAAAIQTVFAKKRLMMLEGLASAGITVECPPEGTFYVWANLKNLPEPINHGMGFFRAALSKKLITVPGQFFDINPGGRRSKSFGRFSNHLRISFGPTELEIGNGLAKIAELVRVLG